MKTTKFIRTYQILNIRTQEAFWFNETQKDTFLKSVKMTGQENDYTIKRIKQTKRINSVDKIVNFISKIITKPIGLFIKYFLPKKVKKIIVAKLTNSLKF